MSIGQANGAGDALALFKTEYVTDVLAAFERKTVTSDKIRVRDIEAGKSATFPVMGKKTAGIHDGSQMTGESAKHNQVVITVDGLLKSDSSIPEIDDAMAHYNVRNEYSFAEGEALATTSDQMALAKGIQAARASATVAGGNGGTKVEVASATDADVIVAGIWSAATALDEKDVPEEDRYFYCKPAVYNLIASHKDVLNADWGGEGSYAKGVVKMVGGIMVVKTNNLPSTNVTAGGIGDAASYDGDYSKTVGLVMHKSAVGRVKLRDITHKMKERIDFADWFSVSSCMAGTDVLRPEAAVELHLPA